MPDGANTVTLWPLHVLVVDDDPAVRGLYVTVLRQAGAMVTSSGKASEAIELTDLKRPDIVVTDLRMPERDGIWLLKELKGRLPAVPVIAVSGHTQPDAREELLRLGFADVLNKPLSLSHLLTVVAHFGHVDGDRGSNSHRG